MKKKKVLAVLLSTVMVASMTACGSSSKSDTTASANASSEETAQAEVSATDASAEAAESESTDGLSYAGIKLGQDYTDLKATITMFNHRTDMDSDDYGGKNWKSYFADFNKEYPNITVKITTDTNYADDALTHLQSGNYETITMIPAVDKADLSTYFLSYGNLETMKTQINYATTWEYDDQVYGVPSTATTQGIVYNKKVFQDAGITELPKTPEDFIEDRCNPDVYKLCSRLDNGCMGCLYRK